MNAGVDLRSSAVPPLRAFLNPLAAGCGLLRHFDLTWQLAQRDLAARYRAARLGLLWAVLTPLLLLAIYTFVFSVVFEARWGGSAGETRGEFALALFCGLMVYNVFSEVMIRAPGVIVGNPNYVKKLVFPLEVFVPAALLVALVNLLINLGVWLAGWLLIMRCWPPATGLWAPLIILPVCLTTLGLGWLAASLGVFLRDLGHVVLLLVQMLFFLTPVFYEAERVPPPYKYLLWFNPLTHSVQDFRGALMWGDPPDWPWLAAASAGSLVLAQIGYAFFMKSKRAFADVL